MSITDKLFDTHCHLNLPGLGETPLQHWQQAQHVMRYLLGNGKIHQKYVNAYTNASYIVKEGFKFEDGLFTGYDEGRKNYVDRSAWDYEFDEQGMAKVDDSMSSPNSVMSLLKAHAERYTPEMVERICRSAAG